MNIYLIKPAIKFLTFDLLVILGLDQCKLTKTW